MGFRNGKKTRGKACGWGRVLAAGGVAVLCGMGGSGCAVMDMIGATKEDVKGACCCFWPFEPGANFIRENHPRKYADYDFRHPTDFREGDRFELLRDMYLFESGVKGEWWLEDTDWNQWGRPVLRVVPAGETAVVSHLKLTPYQKLLCVFFKLDSGEEWVSVDLFYDRSDEDGRLSFKYDRERFRKLEEEGVGGDP